MAGTHKTRLRLYVDWGRTGSYTNESDRLVSANGTWRRNNPEDSITSPRGIVSQATITLINHDLRYSATNGLSPLAAYIEDGGYYQVPMYLDVEEDGAGGGRIFTGIIKGPQEIGGNLDAIGQITFDCRSREELLLQQKLSTLQPDLKAYNDAGKSEAGIILAWLTLAGIDPAEFIHDAGNFVIPWAWLDNESPLEDIWQLAAAGGGAFYTNPNGKFVYETFSHWVTDVESATYERFTDGDYRRGSIRINDDELYETIIIEVASRNVAGSTVVWESPEQIAIPADSTGAVGHRDKKVVVANLQQPLYQLDAILFDASSAGGLNLSTQVDWGGESGFTAYAQRIVFEFANSATTHDAQIKNFKIIGKALTGGQVAEVTKTSTDEFWENRGGRTRTISNQYIQTQAQADSLAQFLIDRHQLPRVFYTLNDCPGKASRYLGMRIVLDPGNLVRTARPALITGISWRWSGQGGFTQTIEAFDCLNLFPYAPTNILAAGRQATNYYFRLNVHTLGGDADDHRVFY